MSQPNSVPPFVNSAMKFVLRSPMHGAVSKSILLITFTGRKSGKVYTTPVSYSRQDEYVYAFTHASWWKNLRGGAPVTLRLRGHDFDGFAEPVAENKEAVAAGLLAHLKKVPGDAKYYDVTLDPIDGPRAEDVAIAAQNTVMIRVRVC